MSSYIVLIFTNYFNTNPTDIWRMPISTVTGQNNRSIKKLQLNVNKINLSLIWYSARETK